MRERHLTEALKEPRPIIWGEPLSTQETLHLDSGLVFGKGIIFVNQGFDDEPLEVRSDCDCDS